MVTVQLLNHRCFYIAGNVVSEGEFILLLFPTRNSASFRMVK